MNIYINYYASKASVSIESAIEHNSEELLAKIAFTLQRGDERME